MDLSKLSSFPQVAGRSIKGKLQAPLDEPSKSISENKTIREAIFHEVSIDPEYRSDEKNNSNIEQHFSYIELKKPSKDEPAIITRVNKEKVRELLELDYESRKRKIEQLLGNHISNPNFTSYKKTLMAIIKTESNFNPLAVSKDGYESKGLFQLLDKTGYTVKERLNDGESYDPFNPIQNIRYGTSYFEYLFNLFQTSTKLTNGYKTFAAATESDLEKFAIAAFNAGEGRVALAQNVAKEKGLDPAIFSNVEPFLPRITQDYVKKVLHIKQNFDARSPGLNFASSQN